MIGSYVFENRSARIVGIPSEVKREVIIDAPHRFCLSWEFRPEYLIIIFYW